MTTRSGSFALRACSHVCWMRYLPVSLARTFPGNRSRRVASRNTNYDFHGGSRPTLTTAAIIEPATRPVNTVGGRVWPGKRQVIRRLRPHVIAMQRSNLPPRRMETGFVARSGASRRCRVIDTGLECWGIPAGQIGFVLHDRVAPATRRGGDWVCFAHLPLVPRPWGLVPPGFARKLGLFRTIAPGVGRPEGEGRGRPAGAAGNWVCLYSRPRPRPGGAEGRRGRTPGTAGNWVCFSQAPCRYK